MADSTQKIDAVFEGGGVKGSALVGAIMATTELGYTFQNLAGTSAGAIVASLVAAGYSAQEIQTVMADLDYRQFKDPTFISRAPIVGLGLSLLIHKGIYKGDAFGAWLRNLLEKKGIKTFKDLIRPECADKPLYRYKLQVVASDITRGNFLILPQNVVDYGMQPDDFDVTTAVRMSMSIPYFYKPVMLPSPMGVSYVVDGGILSNYPVSLFDNGTNNPPWPTIGYKLVDPGEDKPHDIRGPLTLFSALIQTTIEAHDARYIKDSDFSRTVPIPTLGVNTTDFDITKERRQQLFESGYQAAKKFFAQWDFEVYKKKYRSSVEQSRTSKIWETK